MRIGFGVHDGGTYDLSGDGLALLVVSCTEEFLVTYFK